MNIEIVDLSVEVGYAQKIGRTKCYRNGKKYWRKRIIRNYKKWVSVNATIKVDDLLQVYGIYNDGNIDWCCIETNNIGNPTSLLRNKNMKQDFFTLPKNLILVSVPVVTGAGFQKR
jgi:hypothetical protein